MLFSFPPNVLLVIICANKFSHTSDGFQSLKEEEAKYFVTMNLEPFFNLQKGSGEFCGWLGDFLSVGKRLRGEPSNFNFGQTWDLSVAKTYFEHITKCTHLQMYLSLRQLFFVAYQKHIFDNK